jgi:hypothetical protein
MGGMELWEGVEVETEVRVPGLASQFLDASVTMPLRLENFIDNEFMGIAHTSEWIAL